MQVALKLKTTVLPGHRISVDAPELPEGTNVELIILPDLAASRSEAPRQFKDVLEFLDSLPERRRTPEEWEAIERELQEEKAAWER